MPAAKKFTVRKRKFQHLKGPRWEVDCGMIEGKRLRKFFLTRQAADTFADEQWNKLRSHGETSVALTETDRILFQAARDQLASVGATITQAVQFYLSHHKPLRDPISLRELLDKAVVEKELAGRRDHYLSQFACSCRSFIRGREDQKAHIVTKDEVKRWIMGNAWAPKTQRVYLGDLRSLFAWAENEKYIHKNPIAGKEGFIELAATDDAEIAVLDLEQCHKLLHAALFSTYRLFDRKTKAWRNANFHELIGYLAVALFAGVRPEEIKRTESGRVDLHERTLVVIARSSKTRQRRVIELERVAVVWLRLWRWLCPGCELVPRNFVRRWRALRKAAGITKWPHDVLRHSFASYHFAAQQNTARLQAQMGHSEGEDTLFRHYRATFTLSGKTVSKRMAEEFWKLTPKMVRD